MKHNIASRIAPPAAIDQIIIVYEYVRIRDCCNQARNQGGADGAKPLLQNFSPPGKICWT